MMNYRLWGNLTYVVSAYDIFPDGTDVTNKLQALVNLANSEGRTAIFFPPGEYFVTYINNDENIYYFGDNASFIGGYTKKIAQIGQEFSGADSYNVLDFGAKRDYVTDNRTAIQDAINVVSSNGGGELFFPEGHYYIDDYLVLKDKVRMVSVPDTVTLDFSRYNGFHEYGGCIRAQGSLATTSYVPTTAINKGTNEITFPSVTGLEVNQAILISNGESSWGGEGTKGEIQLIAKIDTSTNKVILAGRTFDSYSTSGLKVNHINTITCGMKGFRIIGNGINENSPDNGFTSGTRGDTGVYIQYGKNVTIKDCHFTKIENRCVLLDTTIDSTIDSCVFYFDEREYLLQYGTAVLGACQNITITKCKSYNDRHCFTTAAGIGCPRFINVTGNFSYGSWVNGFNTHRGGEFIIFEGNFVDSKFCGMDIRCKNVTIIGNILKGRYTDGAARNSWGIGLTWSVGEIIISNNQIDNVDTGISLNGLDSISNTNNITIDNNRISNVVRGINLANTSTTDRVLKGLRIIGNTIKIATSWGIYVSGKIAGAVIVHNHTQNTVASGIVCDNPVGYVISENVCEDVPASVYAMALQGTGNTCTVKGNKYINCGRGLSNVAAVDVNSSVSDNVQITF